MAWKCVDCDRVWKEWHDADTCCPHVEDIGGTSTEDCPDCGAAGEDPANDDNECCRCSGTGLAYKRQTVGFAPEWGAL